MKKFIKSVFFVIMLIPFISLGQNVDFISSNFPTDPIGFKNAVRNLDNGNSFYALGETQYPQALKLFMTANQFNPNNAALNFKIGNCYYADDDFSNAIFYFEKAKSLGSTDPLVFFNLGRLYHITHEFDKALENYSAYKRTFEKDFSPQKSAEIEQFISQCKYGAELKKNPINVTIENIGKGINSKFPEYNPVISSDGKTLYFTSRRPSTTGGAKDMNDNKYYEDIYISHKEGNSWSAPENPRYPLNSKSHDATAGVSPDGKTLFVYKGGAGGNIYTSKLKDDGEWSEPQRLNNNINSKAHESAASITADGKTLYFVSEREGGLGGRDVYQSTLDENGHWGPAILVPGKINTTLDEETAFVSPDGQKMYFSSKGHSSMGGYDIFVSHLENGQWSEPENIGYPINTARDDVFFSISENGHHGYYASANFEGYGDKDIYEISFVDVIKKDQVASNEDQTQNQAQKGPNVTEVSGLVLDKETNLPLKAKIIITDISTKEQIAQIYTDISGKYEYNFPPGKNYGINVSSDSYVYQFENLDLTNADGYQKIGKNIYLTKIASTFVSGQGIRLNNIYFDFNKSTLRPESYTEIDQLYTFLKNDPTLKVEISGHTDNVGSAAYNKDLSTRRAKVVVDYLITKGIPAERLTYKGYGFDIPVVPNTTDQNRQLNRRTEFKIIER